MTRPPFDLETWLAGTERSVTREGARERAVVVRRRFAAPIDRVWAAWVEGWTAKIAAGTAAAGETVELDLGQPQRTTCRILACEPPARLAATWTYGALTTSAPDEVEVRLAPAPDGSGTLLELAHRSENGAPWAGGIGSGWEAGLLMFDAMLDGEDPASRSAAFPRLEAIWAEL